VVARELTVSVDGVETVESLNGDSVESQVYSGLDNAAVAGRLVDIDDAGNRLDVDDVRQVPHMIKVSGFNFTPIHKFRPEKQTFKNDKLGTDSTRLVNTGTQRYVDQLRPESTYYDKEVQEAYKSNLEKINLPQDGTYTIPPS
jgi:hypothetical protein